MFSNSTTTMRMFAFARDGNEMAVPTCNLSPLQPFQLPSARNAGHGGQVPPARFKGARSVASSALLLPPALPLNHHPVPAAGPPTTRTANFSRPLITHQRQQQQQRPSRPPPPLSLTAHLSTVSDIGEDEEEEEEAEGAEDDDDHLILDEDLFDGVVLGVDAGIVDIFCYRGVAQRRLVPRLGAPVVAVVRGGDGQGVEVVEA
ncbi:hypothetical protein MBM_04685 [Drepanopeziza brunnea f. sp. 'multigermtubi' MB_m1]|uniref:Uncharacterized protein n=1 Tax=Marssonina brunnea f. sp. multigermtubi (strain MB_m1) TaxID=1072389 RepID=K1X8T5_MARBU|nr:uncharacterized protein MBM_04685 [Drepanopeziza brunnea f. sp. 'multigermtubi' MB_m1]EKD17108.1 hypothetical protein MBM_04685 [Drepanopeziza brunnea f. sp. 'multigermtubi' MB_m1]